jgi:hypothetical protein
MVNRKIWLAILVMALVFGMMVVGCGSPGGSNLGTSSDTGTTEFEDLVFTSGDLTVIISRTAIPTSSMRSVENQPKAGDFYVIVQNRGMNNEVILSKGTITEVVPDGNNHFIITFAPSQESPCSGEEFQGALNPGGTVGTGGKLVITSVEFEGEYGEANGGDATSGFIGATLNLTGQVWEFSPDDDEMVHFTGSTSVSALGKTGTITNGQLNFSIGTPDFDGGFKYMLEDVFWTPSEDMKISTTEIKGNVIFGLEAEINDSFVGKGSWTDDTYEGVFFVYVDRDVTISAEEESDVWGDGVTVRNAYNITLRRGWNAIHEKCHVVSDDDDEVITFAHANPPTMRWAFVGAASSPPQPPPPGGD